MLGDERSVRVLEAFTKDQYLESQLIAVEGLGMLDHPRSLYVLRKTLGNRQMDPMVRVAAARSLAGLGDDRGYDRARRALTGPRAMLQSVRGKRAEIRPAEVTALQTQAAMALGLMNHTRAVDDLYPLLESPRGAVRVAAAQAILRLLRAYRHTATTRPAPKTPAPKPKEPPPPVAPVAPRPKPHTSPGRD